MSKPEVKIKDVIVMGSRINGVHVKGHPNHPIGATLYTSQVKYPEILKNKPEIVETMNTIYHVENWI